MKKISWLALVVFFLGCVPIKKYRDLEANYKKCQSEQAEYKTKAIDYENQVKELNVQLDVLKSDVNSLRADSSKLGDRYRQAVVDLE